MKKQRGLALSSLIFWGIVVTLIAVLGMKVFPAYLEYYKILKDIKATVAKANPDSSVTDIRKIYDKFADIDLLDFKSSDLDISKDGGRIVIEFSYEKRIPLFANLSLLIDYKGTTAE